MGKKLDSFIQFILHPMFEFECFYTPCHAIFKMVAPRTDTFLLSLHSNRK